MFHLRNLLACLLLSVSICQARTGGLRTAAQEKVTLQPWLVGLAAVVGFLFIIFFILIVKRIFFKKDNRDEMETDLEGYENKALDLEIAEETKMSKF
ncbi:small integral membrane protein 24 isoform X1 [Colossoma macropomum]|uniref:small integral membrane protein 24 isoform X1 n=1 Tax=Colossoma macropomum TaxID=42526 RepID=UPI0018651EA5|nr:small integral membrane protein 24 isoform X1 [Colossoma macropomum]